MAITKKATPVVATKIVAKAVGAKPIVKVGKAAEPETIAAVDGIDFMEPITVTKTFEDENTINSDDTETIEIVRFAPGARIGRISLLLGTAAPFGAVKASVTVSVPHYLEESAEAIEYAKATALAVLDSLADVTAAAEEPEPAKKVTGTRKAGAKAAVVEEEPEDAPVDDDPSIGPEDIEAMKRPQIEEFVDQFNEENPAEAVEVNFADYPKTAAGLASLKADLIGALFGDGELPEMFEEDDLNAMDEDQLKEICAAWNLDYSVSKKASSRKAESVALIIEAQEAATAEAEAAD